MSEVEIDIKLLMTGKYRKHNTLARHMRPKVQIDRLLRWEGSRKVTLSGYAFRCRHFPSVETVIRIEPFSIVDVFDLFFHLGPHTCYCGTESAAIINFIVHMRAPPHTLNRDYLII